MCFWCTHLNYKPCHPPLKYRSPIKQSDHMSPTYLRECPEEWIHASRPKTHQNSYSIHLNASISESPEGLGFRGNHKYRNWQLPHLIWCFEEGEIFRWLCSREIAVSAIHQKRAPFHRRIAADLKKKMRQGKRPKKSLSFFLHTRLA